MNPASDTEKLPQRLGHLVPEGTFPVRSRIHSLRTVKPVSSVAYLSFLVSIFLDLDIRLSPCYYLVEPFPNLHSSYGFNTLASQQQAYQPNRKRSNAP